MTEKSVALIAFCCNIKYNIVHLGNRYRIKSKWDDEFFFVSESELYATMEDISDMSSSQFKEYAITKDKDVH